MIFECSLCSRIFSSAAGLSSHTSAVHPHHCLTCARSFSSAQALADHKRDSPRHAYESDNSDDNSATEHSDDDSRYCFSCERWFVDTTALYIHLATNQKHHWCFICSCDFKSAKALEKHSSSPVHADRTFNCPFCACIFRFPSAIAHHIESGCHKITRHQVTAAVHALQIIPRISINRRIRGPIEPTVIKTFATEYAFNGTDYGCYMCKRRFRALNSLNTHLNSAAHDANEFKCPKCGKKVKLISSLVQHIESGACGLAKFNQIEAHFDRLTSQFSKLLTSR